MTIRWVTETTTVGQLNPGVKDDSPAFAKHHLMVGGIRFATLYEGFSGSNKGVFRRSGRLGSAYINPPDPLAYSKSITGALLTVWLDKAGLTFRSDR